MIAFPAGSRRGAGGSEQRAATAEADLERARAVVSTSAAMIAGLKLEIALLKRDRYGRSAERSAKLLDQLELQLEELVADAAEDRVRAERKTTKVGAFERRKPVKKAFPDHLPRERVVVAAPSTWSCCGSDRIVKMGEDITETLEVIPRQWKVIQTVREKFTCRACEKISQPPAPFQPIPRGWAGSSLLAMIVFGKYGQHQPLNSLIEAHVFSAARLHGDGEPSRRHAFETDGEHGAAAGARRDEDGAALDLCAR